MKRPEGGDPLKPFEQELEMEHECTSLNRSFLDQAKKLKAKAGDEEEMSVQQYFMSKISNLEDDFQAQLGLQWAQANWLEGLVHDVGKEKRATIVFGGQDWMTFTLISDESKVAKDERAEQRKKREKFRKIRQEKRKAKREGKEYEEPEDEEMASEPKVNHRKGTARWVIIHKPMAHSTIARSQDGKRLFICGWLSEEEEKPEDNGSKWHSIQFLDLNQDLGYMAKPEPERSELYAA